MRLTEAQIEKLFAFVKKKHVPFYDLQIEIVDHLAQRIEDEIDSTPDLEFEPALQKVYDGFGIFGFAHIVQERQKAIDLMGKKELPSGAEKTIYLAGSFEVFAVDNDHLLHGNFSFCILVRDSRWRSYDSFRIIFIDQGISINESEEKITISAQPFGLGQLHIHSS